MEEFWSSDEHNEEGNELDAVKIEENLSDDEDFVNT